MAIKTTAEFVTPEDFKTYTGIDLSEELAIGKTPDIFLRDAEDHLIQYVNIQSWRPITKWIYQNKYSEIQQEMWREAILIQAKYEFYNSDLTLNAGIDPLDGQKMTPSQREQAYIAPEAIKKCMRAGLITRTMITRF